MAVVSNPVRSGHSAQVEITLLVNGVGHRVGQLGPDFLILEKSCICQPTSAEIVMNIDGKERRWAIFLPNGVRSGERRVRFE